MGYATYNSKEPEKTKRYVLSLNLKEVETWVEDKKDHERHIRTIFGTNHTGSDIRGMFALIRDILVAVENIELNKSALDKESGSL